MKNRLLRQGVAVAAAGSLMSGCTTHELSPEEIRTIDGIELHYDTGEAPNDETADLEIIPADLPYSDLELPGNMYEADGTTTYHVVAQAKREDDRFEFAANKELDDTLQDNFTAALGESENLISAAANRGLLDHVIFARGLPSDESTQSHYNPIGKVVAVTIHERGVSYDELVAVLQHELWHAVTVDLNFSEAEWENDYSKACDELNELYVPEAIEYLEQIVYELRSYVESKRSAHPEDYAQYSGPLEAVDDYLEAGKGAEDIWLYCGQLSVSYALSDLEEAALGLEEGEIGELGGYMFTEDIFKDMNTDSELFRAIGREFIEGDTVYADVSEFSYVESDSEGSAFLGHAAEADNFSEIWASILNTSTRYTDDFAEKVAEMHPSERKFVLTFLGLTIDHTIELNPGLADYLNTKESYIRQRVEELKS